MWNRMRRLRTITCTWMQKRAKNKASRSHSPRHLVRANRVSQTVYSIQPIELPTMLWCAHAGEKKKVYTTTTTTTTTTKTISYGKVCDLKHSRLFADAKSHLKQRRSHLPPNSFPCDHYHSSRHQYEII